MSRAVEVALPAWANGPEASGNGGFCAGVCAALVAGDPQLPVMVTLKAPPPLERALRVKTGETGSACLVDEDRVIVEAAPGVLDRFVPAIARELDPERARAASASFGFRDEHPFPTCLVCGTRRPSDSPGLGLHCGTIPGYALTGGVQVYSDAWVVDPELVARTARDLPCDELGTTPERLLAWAALDCPSAAPFADPRAPSPVVLGRLVARIVRDPRPGEVLVASAWSRGIEGRKHFSSSVLVASGGEVVGVADATWIALRA